MAGGFGQSIVTPVVQAHVDLAAFLWMQRSALLAADPPDPVAVERTTDRLTSNLDGLKIAGKAAWPLVQRRLDEDPGAGEFFVAAVVAIVEAEESWMAGIAGTARDNAAAEGGLRGALAWLEPQVTGYLVRRWIADADPFLCRMATGAIADHRVDPKDKLRPLLTHTDAGVRKEAFRAAALLDRKDALDLLRAAVQAETEPAVRLQAAMACATLGDAAGLEVLRTAATQPGPEGLVALRLAVSHPKATDTREWLGGLFGRDETSALAVRGSGMLGDRTILPWLIRQMQDPALADAAGRAFLDLFPEATGRDELFSLEPQDFDPRFSEHFSGDLPLLPVAARVKVWASGRPVR